MGNDTIDPGLGNDTVDGGADNDLLIVDYSSLTSDISSTNSGTSGTISTSDNGVNYSNIERMNLSGGSGNDSLIGTSGNDTISGNAGEDYLVGGEGDDSLDGGANNDTLDGGSGNNTLNGGAGDDTFNVIDTGTVIGGDGNDVFIFYGQFTGSIDGGGGSDRIEIAPSYTGDIIFPGAPGVPGAIAGVETVVVQSSSGNDYLIGGEGNDSLDGQGGNDTLEARGGNDTLLGGTGNDVLQPGLGLDTVDGGADNDLLIVDYSSVSTDVSSSHDNGSGIISTTDNQVDYSLIERLNLTTGSGNDLLVGTAGNDTLIAGEGTDSLFAGAGSDSLDAGGGNDTLLGVNPNSSNPGLGEIDTLAGGTDADRFILGDATWLAYDDRNTATSGTEDHAKLTDFDPDFDVIQLQGTPENYRIEVSPDGLDTLLYLDKPGSEPDELIAIIQGVTGLNLNSSGFEYIEIPTTTTFDIDGDGQYLAAVDGLLFYGYLNVRSLPQSLAISLTQELADNLINPDSNATRTTGAEIVNYLEADGEMMDIDGDGEILAAIDGLLAYGYLNIRDLGPQPLVETLTQQLADNLIPDDSMAIRTTGAEISAFIESYIV
jgi:Ca2+-binding RTX toxin-like protein